MGKSLHIGNSEFQRERGKVHGSQVVIENETYYKIENSDAIRPFFMSIVSDSNHWMFISSNGGLSAGRKNSEYALFPYYTDDKITESIEITGSKTILRVNKEGKILLWEPFSSRYEGIYKIRRNLYKNSFGNRVLFEEINKDLGLIFRYQWNTSNDFGFVRRVSLENTSNAEVRVAVLDGIQNLLPYGVTTELQNTRSNLVDAYKKNELLPAVGLGIYALSAIIVDKAEPSEALKANIAWSIGLKDATHLVSSLQLDAFRKGLEIQEETDIKAEKGAYFINRVVNLGPNSKKSWMIVANVNQSASAVFNIAVRLKSPTALEKAVLEDIKLGTQKLKELTAAADGLQLTRDGLRSVRHFSNVLYNIMRGGIFDNNYDIDKADVTKYIQNANRKVYNNLGQYFKNLPDLFTLEVLREVSLKSKDVDFQRLCFEYLPLKFSRRHGDPSRPWNKFSINTRSEIDGSKILDYQGNWRDIFQNWEALAHSYPEFIDSMIHKFLNASTFEGYNPYRVTKDGFDWEVIEPNDPWSYIGYWGDHQIIYLLKFLEFIEDYYPSRLSEYWDKDLFVYANVPYKIKSYPETVTDPKNTINFDHDLDQEINKNKAILGADGALVTDAKGIIYHVNLVEKLLATVLAKCSNFIPEAGIWLNTQRPEWNDANNALVGNGVSMVTLYYLRRFLVFFRSLLTRIPTKEIPISEELFLFFNRVLQTLEEHQNSLQGKVSDKERFAIMDGLGMAGSDYREGIYKSGYGGKKKKINHEILMAFTDRMLYYLEHSIEANKKKDNLYHSYNLIALDREKGATIAYLNEMLEGQVAVLSSGYLGPEASLALLDSLKKSALYRKDQYSYILYPDKELARFMDKNLIPAKRVKNSELLTRLVQDGDQRIIETDLEGNYYFNGNFNNSGSLKKALEGLANTGYKNLVANEKELVLEIFEAVFNHKSFTGRSGTFFGYEGLGSIYWHMVSKLLLAVMECCSDAIANGTDKKVIDRLVKHYYEINEGIGVHKSPDLYGAFPTDPYSHTPAHKGAQQPGMTGQVKEDILSRMAELGIKVKGGTLGFGPGILQENEFTKEATRFTYVDINSKHKELPLKKKSLCFTYCQIPVIYELGKVSEILVCYQDKPAAKVPGHRLSQSISSQIFRRTGDIQQLVVTISPEDLRQK